MSSYDSSLSLPPVDVSTMPAAVRKGGTKAEQLYSTALQFEQVLVEQLTQQMSVFGGDDGSSDDDSSDDGSSSDGTTSMYEQMLPDALAQGITNGGGIGLASSLYDSMAAAQGLPTTNGGTQ